jgi:acetyltransferase-like isoleucine patch superfamily enzyme
MKDIFERLLNGESVPFSDPEYYKIHEVVMRTMKISHNLNNSSDYDEVRKWLGEITGEPIDPSTNVFVPFYTNFGKFIRLGKNVFVNHGCTFLDLGGITIEDGVLIGPKVNLISESHPLNPAERNVLDVKSVLIKQNAWIGAAATILPGVTVGRNSVVAAGALVTRDVPDNSVVAGVPAKIVKELP